MQHTITAIYCLCDDFLKSIGYNDDPQVKMTTSEVMTIPLVSARYLWGQYQSNPFISYRAWLPYESVE